MKEPRILYFIGGAIPTDEEKAIALSFGSNVAFRNATFVKEEDSVEPCDGVTGLVPAQYKAKFKDAADVITAFRQSLPRVGQPVPVDSGVANSMANSGWTSNPTGNAV